LADAANAGDLDKKNPRCKSAGDVRTEPVTAGLPARLLSTLGAEQRQLNRRCFAGSALGSRTATSIANFGRGTGCFVFTGARFGIARLDGDGEAYE